jgi:hypothetical protein
MTATAVLSDCGTYRYRLGRRWAEGPVDVWIMLNPSTADATVDDRTIRRCMEFSRRWGAGALVVGNLFALRATDPAELVRHPDPIGPDNDEHLTRSPPGRTSSAAGSSPAGGRTRWPPNGPGSSTAASGNRPTCSRSAPRRQAPLGTRSTSRATPP